MLSPNKITDSHMKNGVVVILDALGTKGIWQKNDPEKVLANWEYIIQQFKIFVVNQQEFTYTFNAFSDTIIVTCTSKDNTFDLMHHMSTVIGSLFVMAMANGIFLRGGFSYGKFYHSDTIVLGQAVDEVAEYYTLPEWLGISASPSAYNLLNELQKKRTVPASFERYDIPLKNSMEREGWTLGWPRVKLDFKLANAGKLGKSYNNFEDIFDDQLSNLTDITNAMKWRNTVTYFNHIKKKYQL